MKIGIDIGGTFTDFVVYDESTGEVQSYKLPSTPQEPERAVLEGLERLALTEDTAIVHGSTVATNAVLERKGARTAFIATEGFKDLLYIGRQNRSHLYDLAASRPAALVPPELNFEISERVASDASTLVAIDESQLSPLIDELGQHEIASVAVCFLFSFLHPEHEQRMASALAKEGYAVSLSSEVLPEFREYERASTTAINAYVMPVVDRYLGRLNDGLDTPHLSVMNSNGGSLSAAEARAQPVKAILSGPAAGVVGALHVAKRAGFDQIISFDMGGTSTDVSLCINEPQLTSEGEIAGLPLRVPMLDLHTIGAGGGSIAALDAGGQLRVGPQSAGADPGPVCYARGGTAPTVTDANLAAGRLDPERFLSGEMRLNTQAPIPALEEISEKLGLSLLEAVLGIIRIVNSQMANAIRLVSATRGHDPREFTLVSFGGAGGLHACDVAREVGIRTVMVPRGASTLSAFGMLASDVIKDYSLTVMLPGDAPMDEIKMRFHSLELEGRRDLEAHGFGKHETEIVRELDLRYSGQSYELRLPFGPSYIEDFHHRHREAYGYSEEQRAVEIVNLRLRAVGREARPEIRSAIPDPMLPETKPYRSAHGAPDFYDGAELHPGTRLSGPAVITYPDTTVYLGPTDTAMLDGFRNLITKVGSP